MIIGLPLDGLKTTDAVETLINQSSNAPQTTLGLNNDLPKETKGGNQKRLIRGGDRSTSKISKKHKHCRAMYGVWWNLDSFYSVLFIICIVIVSNTCITTLYQSILSSEISHIHLLYFFCAFYLFPFNFC